MYTSVCEAEVTSALCEYTVTCGCRADMRQETLRAVTPAPRDARAPSSGSVDSPCLQVKAFCVPNSGILLKYEK